MFSTSFQVRRALSILSVIGLIFVAVACDEDPLRKGQAALFSENPDIAEKNLNAVLKKDPENLEAKRLMGEVYRLRKDYAQAEKTLLELWEAQGLSDEKKDLTPEQKTLKKNMSQQFEDVYREWAASLDPKEDVETFLGVVSRGLERDPKDTKLNPLIVDYWLGRGEVLIEAGKKAEAAEAFEKVLSYRALPAQRTSAEERARNLRLEVFTETVRTRVTSLKAGLVETQRWSEERKAITDRIEVDVDRKLKASSPEDLQKARGVAAPSVTTMLLKNVEELTGTKGTPGDAKGFGLPKHSVDGETLKRGKYSLTTYVAVDDAIAWAFKVIERQRTSKPTESSPEPTDEAAPDAGSPAAP